MAFLVQICSFLQNVFFLSVHMIIFSGMPVLKILSWRNISAKFYNLAIQNLQLRRTKNILVSILLKKYIVFISFIDKFEPMTCMYCF